MTLDPASFLPRRAGAFLAVVGLHLVMIHLVATGLATRAIIQWLPPETTGLVLDEPRTTATPPPPPAPTLAHVTPELPVIDTSVDEAPAAPDAITAVSPCQAGGCDQAPVGTPVQPPVRRVPGGIGTGFPNTEDFYPPSAIRLAQQGAAAVQVCVDGRGQLTAAPALAESSGIASIDQAALRLARAGSGRYRPTTENGQPVSACYAIHVRFNLRN